MRAPLRFSLTALFLAGLVGSCVSRESPLGLGDSSVAGVALSAAFIATPADADAAAINRIRYVVRTTTTNAVLLDETVEVSPTDASWAADLSVPTTGSSMVVVVLLDLIHVAEDGAESVEFSGMTAPMTLRPGTTVEPADIALVRGPLANLFTTGVSITSAPSLLQIASSEALSASATTSGSVPPTIFWSALDPSVVIMVDSFATGVGAGTARVVASAGAFADTATISVPGVPVDSVHVSPDSVLIAIGTAAAYRASLFDEDGGELLDRPVLWTIDDAKVATIDALTGHVVGVADGRTTVTATSQEVSDEAIVVVVTPRQVDIGQRVEGFLEVAGEQHFYSFDGSSDDVVTVAFGLLPDFEQGLEAELIAPSGEPVATVAANTHPELTLTETGTHVLHVRSTDVTGTGGYGFSIEGVKAPSPDALAMPIGDGPQGSIGGVGDVDVYAFEAIAGEGMSVQLDPLSGWGGGGSPQLWIFGPLGALLGSVDAGQSAEFTFLLTGTHVIQVHSNDLVDVGGYQFSTADVTPRLD